MDKNETGKMQPIIFKELLKVRTSEEKCDKHQILKMQYDDQKPFCRSCALESIQADNEKRTARALKLEQERKRYNWRTNSLLEDKTLLEARFEGFRTKGPAEEEVKAKAVEIAERYANGEVFNTVLTGAAGSGKSHLAMAMLLYLMEKEGTKQTAAFVSTSEILRKIRSSFDGDTPENSEEKVLSRYAEPDILILDDLGSETGGIGTTKKASDFTQNILYSLSNRRQDRSTIITTNLTGAQLREMYDGKLISRLMRRTKGNTIIFKNITDKRTQLDF